MTQRFGRNKRRAARAAIAQAEARATRAEREADEARLRRHWRDFCDADPFPGRGDFTDRMEAAGLIELAPVDAEALEDPFAYERGIESGGMMWVLTPAGHSALTDRASASAPEESER